MDENSLVEWLYTECPEHLKSKKFRHGLNKIKILGALISHSNSKGCTKQSIGEYTGIPVKNLGRYLSDLTREGLIISTHPYNKNTRYRITDDGKEIFKLTVEIAKEVKGVWEIEG